MLEAAIDRGIHIGRHRTLTQDTSLGSRRSSRSRSVRCLPQSTTRSPALPCVDWLADACFTLAGGRRSKGTGTTLGSRLRVWMPPVRLERLAKLAFDQIRQGLGDDTRCTDPPARRDWPAGTATSGRLPSKRCRIKRTRSSKPRAHWSRLIARDLDAAWRRARARSKRCPRHKR